MMQREAVYVKYAESQEACAQACVANEVLDIIGKQLIWVDPFCCESEFPKVLL